MNAPPPSFLEASLATKRDHENELRQELLELERMPIEEWAPSFGFLDEGIFDRVRRTVVIVDGLERRAHRCTFENIERVTFTPSPSKYEGAWLVYVEFRQGFGMPSGKEFYVQEEQLWKAWEAAAE